MSVRENLIKAKELISDPEKWIKGRHSQNGCYCALGAIGKAYSDSPQEGWMTAPAYHAISRLVPNSIRSVAQYNDLETTTHADIMALFDRAIEASK